MDSERLIAIGDIHGCIDALDEILEQAKSYPDHRLVFLGDYIDRGPGVDAVISRLRELKDAIFIYGNHEWWLVQTIEEISNKKKRRQFLKTKNISEVNYRWLKENLVFIYETDHYIFTHSGLNPSRSLEEQTKDDYVFSYSKMDFKNITSKIIVHAHIRVPEVLIEGNKIKIDTGCSMGGHLSGILFPELKILRSKPTLNYLKLSVSDIISNFKKQIQNEKN